MAFPQKTKIKNKEWQRLSLRNILHTKILLKLKEFHPKLISSMCQRPCRSTNYHFLISPITVGV